MSDVDDVDTFYVFMVNFDDTYPHDSVNSLFADAQLGDFKKYGEPRTVRFQITNEEALSEDIEDVSTKWAEGDHYDMAVLVVNAHETRLNITEPIYGYNPAYEALRQCSGDRVVVVLGGDTNEVAPGTLRSQWVQTKVGRQFEEEYMDGQKGLLLSWDYSYQTAHVEALRAFALPKYVYLGPNPCTPLDKAHSHEMKMASLMLDDAHQLRDDVKHQESESDSDDEPHHVTETTVEISAPPLSDIEENGKESSSSESTCSEESEEVIPGAEKIPLMDDEDENTNYVESATLPIVRCLSVERRTGEEPEEKKNVPSEEDDSITGSTEETPEAEKIVPALYPDVSKIDAIEVDVLVKESPNDDAQSGPDKTVEQPEVDKSGVDDKDQSSSDESSSDEASDNHSENLTTKAPSDEKGDDESEKGSDKAPNDESDNHSGKGTDQVTSSEKGEVQGEKDTEENIPDEKDDDQVEKSNPDEDNESTCLLTVDTKEGAPNSDDDDIITKEPLGFDVDDHKYIQRPYNKGDTACCLCFGGCWSGEESVTDEDMIL